jgi:hypothetical protein
MKLKAVTALVLLALVRPAASAPVEHVIFISVDGLRADLLSDLLTEDATGDFATFQRLVDEGASTFNARTDYSITKTLPNHTTMLTGRPVLQPDDQPDTVHHGYSSNSTPGPEDTLHNQGNPALDYVPSVFDVVHDHGLTTALYASKEKFAVFDRSYDAAHGAPDVTGLDDGADKIDAYLYAELGSPATAAPMHAAFAADLADGPAAFTFVSYRDPDSAGHDSAWASPTWNDAVRAVDGYLGDVLELVEATPDLADRTVVIVTSDHGGAGFGHSDPANRRDYQIPFFVWGADVLAGSDLYALNPGTREDPGNGRPDYGVAVAPIRNGDGANLALRLLGLPPIPGSTINAAQELMVSDDGTAAPGPALPRLLSGLGAHPNPFRSGTQLTFALERAGRVRLGIYDVSGRMVRVLADGPLSAGEHAFDFVPHGVGSGVYFVRIELARGQESRKLVLRK